MLQQMFEVMSTRFHASMQTFAPLIDYAYLIAVKILLVGFWGLYTFEVAAVSLCTPPAPHG